MDFQNTMAWSNFAKRFQPIITYSLKRNKLNLIIAFVGSMFASSLLFNSKLFETTYSLSLSPIPEAEDHTSFSKDWGSWLGDYLTSQPEFNTQFWEDVSYVMEKKDFAIVVRASYRNSSYVFAADSILKRIIMGAEIKNKGSFSIETNITGQSVNTKTFLIILTLSTLFTFAILIFIVIFYLLSDRIFDNWQLQSVKESLLGLLPISHDKTSVLNYPRSPFAEELRALYGKLILKLSTDDKLIMITSALPNEGKSTISSEFAMAISNWGKRILLIEADIRNPSIAEILSLSEKNQFSGLSAYLSEKCELHEILIKTNKDNLHVILIGEKDQISYDQLSGEKFKRMLIILREQYDLIILDTPPRFVPDSTYLAKLADAILVITRFNYSSLSRTLETFTTMRNIKDKTFVIGNYAENANMVNLEAFNKTSFTYDYSYYPYSEKPIKFWQRMFQKKERS